MRYNTGDDVRIIYESWRLTTGLSDAKIDIWKPDLTKAVSNTAMTEIGSGMYYYDYTPTATGTYVCLCDSVTQPRVSIDKFFVDNQLTNSRKVLTNKWLIAGNQLKIYDDDETTVLYTFDLKDNVGQASSENVYQRDPV